MLIVNFRSILNSISLFAESNWTNDTSLSDNKDELFKGSMFDFRMYNKYMPKSKVKKTYKWGTDMLGVKPISESE